MAVKHISNELQVDEAPRDALQVDKDTKNVPGSPPIFEMTRRKIDAAGPNGDPCPNLNVLSGSTATP